MNEAEEKEESPVYTPLVLTPAQAQIENNPARFKWVKAGRRGGKSKYGIDWIIRKAIQNPGEECWLVAPTWNMVHEIGWRELLKSLPPSIVNRKHNSELWVELINDARISLKSSDHPDTLRGRKLAALVMDEAAYQKPFVYTEVLRPMLADLEAPLLAISTPRRGWFSRQWEMAKLGKSPNSAAFHFTIYDNPYITRSEIEEIKKTSTNRIWLQEYMAEEVDASGVVYAEFMDSAIFDPSVDVVSRSWPCVVGIDWGLGDSTAAVWLHVSTDGHVWVSQEHSRSGWNVERHSRVIHQYGKKYNVATGNYVLDQSAFRREGTSGISIADQFKQEGIVCMRSQKDFDASVDIVKRFMCGDGSRSWLHISAGCRDILNGIQCWEHDQHEPDTLAAMRYGLVHLVRRGLTTLMHGNEASPEIAVKQPVGNRLSIRPSGGDIQWNWDAGCPE